MTNISASLIKDYIVCPRKAYYRLFFSGEVSTNKHIVVGNIVHHALENFWDSKKACIEYANQKIKESTIKLDTDKIFNSFDNFFEIFYPLLTPEDQIEYYFKYKYSDVNIVGKIDRIKKGGIIFDWKTSLSKPDVEKDIQFILYYLSYEKVFGKVPNSVIYAQLPTGIMYQFKPNKEYIDEFKYNILPHVVNTIRTSVLNLPRNGLFLYDKTTCRDCLYKDVCYEELYYG